MDPDVDLIEEEPYEKKSFLLAGTEDDKDNFHF
jgi:hypothetical protein